MWISFLMTSGFVVMLLSGHPVMMAGGVIGLICMGLFAFASFSRDGL